MPTYVFRCPEGHVIEEIHSINDDIPSIQCFKCLKPAAKIIAPTHFVLSGPNWPGKEAKNKK